MRESRCFIKKCKEISAVINVSARKHDKTKLSNILKLCFLIRFQRELLWLVRELVLYIWIFEIICILLSALIKQEKRKNSHVTLQLSLLYEDLFVLKAKFNCHLDHKIILLCQVEVFRTHQIFIEKWPSVSFSSICETLIYIKFVTQFDIKISRVLIGQHLISCSPTWLTCCNSPRKCTPVKAKMEAKSLDINLLKRHSAMVSCWRFIWITNSSDYRRVWATNLLHTKSLRNPLGHKA